MNKKYLFKLLIAICSLYYLWMLIKIIILKNGINSFNCNINLELFDFIDQYHRSGINITFLINVLGNIALFIPLSIILKHYFRFLNYYNILFTGFITSLSFELIQLGSGWGIFDVDDIVLNTLGCIIGIGIHYLIKKHQNYHVSVSLFLICFGSLGMISVYSYYPSLLITFI